MNDAGTSRHSADRERTWIVVCGGFHRRGGMDKANLALALHLSDHGRHVHLVGREFDDELRARPTVTCHRVPSGGSVLLGEVLLERTAKKIIRLESANGGEAPVVVANGSNLRYGGVNWVHYVHHAWQPRTGMGARAVKELVASSRFRRRERQAIGAARLVIANSQRTRQDLIEKLRIDPGRIRVVYLGAENWGTITEAERTRARTEIAIGADVPVIAFIGALSPDDRKGLATTLEAWKILRQQGQWDGVLLIAGSGSRLGHWRRFTAEMGDSVRLLGFSENVPTILAASDILVSPVHYESYGLNVQEALARGLPAIVSSSAGVAERYSGINRDLLLANPSDGEALAALLRQWRGEMNLWRERIEPLTRSLQSYGWEAMAAAITGVIDEEYAIPDRPAVRP